MKPIGCLYLTFFLHRLIENNMTNLVWREKTKLSDAKARPLPFSLSVRVSGFLLPILLTFKLNHVLINMRGD